MLFDRILVYSWDIILYSKDKIWEEKGVNVISSLSAFFVGISPPFQHTSTEKRDPILVRRVRGPGTLSQMVLGCKAVPPPYLTKQLLVPGSSNLLNNVLENTEDIFNFLHKISQVQYTISLSQNLGSIVQLSFCNKKLSVNSVIRLLVYRRLDLWHPQSKNNAFDYLIRL